MPPDLAPDNLKSCRILAEKRNLVFYGNVGTGKTHLTIVIRVEACKQGKRVGFYRTPTLVNQLAEAKKRGELTSLLKQLSKLDFLICDEWGVIPLEREGLHLLF